MKYTVEKNKIDGEIFYNVFDEHGKENSFSVDFLRDNRKNKQ